MSARNEPTRCGLQGASEDRLNVTVSPNGDLDIHIHHYLVRWWRVLIILVIVVILTVLLSGGTDAWKHLLRALSKH